MNVSGGVVHFKVVSRVCSVKKGVLPAGPAHETRARACIGVRNETAVHAAAAKREREAVQEQLCVRFADWLCRGVGVPKVSRLGR